MSDQQKKKQKRTLVMIFGGAALAMILCAGLVVMLIFHDDSGSRKKRTHMVTLLKPPPPPPPKVEQPPPPKQEEVVEEPEPDESPDDGPEEVEGPPPGELLGLDADGTAGGDSFGLVGRKGGRSIIGGDGIGSLLAKYAWYTRLVKDELEKLVRKKLEETGGIPSGKLEAVIAMRIDDFGKVTGYKIVSPSGNIDMDTALEKTLKVAVLRDPPPVEMPRVIKMKILSQG